MNTVLGMKESEFRAVWISKLWMSMFKLGKGYRKGSQRRTLLEQRRADKVGTTKVQRRLRGQA